MNLVKVSLDALVDAAEVFPSVIRMDLYASILHIFTTLLGTGVCQADVVPRSLPIFKRFITIITTSGAGNDVDLVARQLRGCLHSILNILDNTKYRPYLASNYWNTYIPAQVYANAAAPIQAESC